MEEENEMYKKFKKFLSHYLIRKAEGKLSAHDFAEENFEYLRTILKGLLSTLNLTDSTRLQIYFNDLLVYCLTGEVGMIEHASRTSSSSISNINETDLQSLQVAQIPKQITDAFNMGEQMPGETQGVTAITDENGTQSSLPKRLRTQIQSEEISEPLHSQSNDKTCDPLDAQMTRAAPLMQSTPLSVPLPSGGQFQLEMTQEDNFIADIISQINVSPIPLVTDDDLVQEPCATSEVTFLKEFSNVSRRTNERKRAEVASSQRIRPCQERPNEALLRQPLPEIQNINFDVICSIKKTWPYYQKDEESFLYFSVKPGKMKNMVKLVTNNVDIPETESGHISISRRTNISNVIRAHVSQRQSSIEQFQMSFASNLRSPSTPQALLRTSQLEPFTPVRGEVLTHSPMMELEFMSSLPMRPLLRQQPLLTIPERDSTIPIPLSPPTGDVEINNIINDELTRPTDDVSTLPLEVAGNQSYLNLPNAVTEDVEMVQEQPPIPCQTISESNAVVPMPVEFSLLMDPVHPVQNVVVSENDIAGHQNAVGSTDHVPENELPLDGNDVQLNQPQGDAPFSWFEVLRPRGEVTYPKVGSVRRKKTNKRKIEREDVQLPQTPVAEIPMNTEQRDIALVTQVTHTQTEEIGPNFYDYFSLIKEPGTTHKSRTLEQFDPCLLSETYRFEMLDVLKRMLKGDMVYMDALFKDGTSRLEAAKCFTLILELKTMGLIEIEAIDSRIVGFKLNGVPYSS